MLSRPLPLRVGVFGAGAVGCHVGVHLAAAGAEVVLLGRPWLAEVARDLTATDLRGRAWRPKSPVTVVTDPGGLADVDVCLVTVKSRDTEAAGEALVRVLAPGTPVLSLQNGLRNPGRLRELLPDHPVLGGVVAPNIVFEAPHHTRQATRGGLFSEPGTGREAALAERLAAHLRQSPLRLTLTADFANVAAGKLLMNLNNGVCAATGLTIPGMLADDCARTVFARCIGEGLTVLRAAGYTPRRAIALPPGLVAALLGLPAWLVGPAARLVVSPDAAARGSTLQDLDRGRPTEIAELNGDVARRARPLGMGAPWNATVTAAVLEIEGAIGGGATAADVFLPPARLLERCVEAAQEAAA